MLNFPVPPDYCLVLKAINDTLSLREAAQLLDYDPGALARKVARISKEFDFLHKVDNKWVLSEQGRRLVQWVDESSSIQLQLLHSKPTYRVASYVWITEQILIPHFPKLNEKTVDKYNWSFKLFFKNCEKEILGSKFDFGFVAHPPFDPEISHKKLSGEHWCIIVPAAWEKEIQGMNKDQIVSYLKRKPFISRDHFDLATIMKFTPETMASIHVEGVPAIRTAVTHGLGWSCVPGIGVKESISKKELYRVDYPIDEFGEIYLWWVRSRKDLKDVVPVLVDWFNSTF